MKREKDIFPAEETTRVINALTSPESQHATYERYQLVHQLCYKLRDLGAAFDLIKDKAFYVQNTRYQHMWQQYCAHNQVAMQQHFLADLLYLGPIFAEDHCGGPKGCVIKAFEYQ